MDSLAFTGDIVEITASLVAISLTTVLVVFLIPRALPRLSKVLLVVATLGMLYSSLCTICYISVASFINTKNAKAKQDALLYIRIAQTIGAQSTSISVLLLVIERLMFTVVPRFRNNSFLRSAVLSVVVVFIIVGMAVIYAFSAISWNLLNVVDKCMIVPEILIIPLCFLGEISSRKLYKSQIAIVSLNIRYEVSETIELTRVIFPICAIDSLLSIVTIIFGFLMSAKIIDFKTYTPIARWISTIQSLSATILILSRHRLFRRRIRKIFGLKGPEKAKKVQPLTKFNETDAYFDMVRKQW